MESQLDRYGVTPDVLYPVPPVVETDPLLVIGVRHIGPGSRRPDMPHDGRWIVEMWCGRQMIYSTDTLLTQRAVTHYEAAAQVAEVISATGDVPRVHGTRLALWAATVGTAA